MRRRRVTAVAAGCLGMFVLCPAACAPSATVERAATEESFAHLRRALAAYDSAGFLTGPPDFPVVGRPVVLAGPGDSVFVGFAASMPASALRFARDDGLVAARYQVTMLVRSDADTLARIDRREIVRVEDFVETSSREPRIVFQRFVGVPAGRLTLAVTVRELTSRKQAEQSFTLDRPSGLAQPLLAYRAESRTSLADPPAVLLHPRNTAHGSRESPVVVLEDAHGPEGPVLLRVDHEGARVWSDTFELASNGGGPPSLVAALPVHLLPPGLSALRAERLDDGIVRAAPLYIGMSPEWVLPSWGESTAHLVHALDPDTLESWREAPPAERAGMWRRFQARTDPDAGTSANEFLARYFERMSLANDRFDEPGRAGWETERGEVLVKLGEPDRERFIRPERQGEVPRIEWEYEETVPSSALIAFEDASDFGVFVMTPRSRAVLRRVVRELAEAAGRTGPE